MNDEATINRLQAENSDLRGEVARYKRLLGARMELGEKSLKVLAVLNGITTAENALTRRHICDLCEAQGMTTMQISTTIGNLESQKRIVCTPAKEGLRRFYLAAVAHDPLGRVP